MYRGLRTSGFGIVEKKTSYLPFKINLILEKIKASDESTKKDASADGAAAVDGDDANDSDSEYYLLAYCKPICTAYKGTRWCISRLKTIKL